MSERTFKIADAILDSAIEEYRKINLANEEAVEQYAFEAMDESITSEEARAILDACNEYLAVTESPDFDGEGQKAFDHIIGALKDFRLSHGGQRIGAGRKNAGTKAVLVRLTDAQHETLKELGGSKAVQIWLAKEGSVKAQALRNKNFVIDLDFDRLDLMTDEQVEDLKSNEYTTEEQWDTYGPYVLYSFKDVIELINDKIEQEMQSEEPDVCKIGKLNDRLKDLVDLL